MKSNFSRLQSPESCLRSETASRRPLMSAHIMPPARQTIAAICARLACLGLLLLLLLAPASFLQAQPKTRNAAEKQAEEKPVSAVAGTDWSEFLGPSGIGHST